MKSATSLLVAVCISLIACNNSETGKTGTASSKNNTDSSFTIKGEVKNLPSGNPVYLKYNTDGKDYTDTVISNNQVFIFKGTIAYPSVAKIAVKQNNFDDGYVSFVIENGTITLKGDTTRFETANVSGSPANDDANSFNNQPEVKRTLTQIDSLLSRAKLLEKEGGAAQSTYDLIIKKYKAVAAQSLNFTKLHNTSYSSIFLLGKYYALASLPDSLIIDACGNLDKNLLTHTIQGIKVANKLESIKYTSIGQPAPDFSLPALNNKQIAVSSFKGKYVLVDFWASWCGPCRKENPNVVAAYQKFKSKHFDVLSVSLDTDSAQWRKAVTADKLAWTNVSNLQGWKNDFIKTYGIVAIPYNFLLNKEGKIIAKNLRGEELLNFLAKEIR